MLSESDGGTDQITVVYLVVSHDNPRQILRLVGRLIEGDPNAHVVVTHDYASCPLEPGHYGDQPRIHFMPPGPPRPWGRWPVTEAELRAIRWAVDHLEFDWLTLLSGQDYPLRPLPSFRAELAASAYDAYLRANPVAPPDSLSRDSGTRYMQARHYFRWYALPGGILRWSARRPRATRLILGLQRRLSFAQPFVFVWSMPRGGANMIGFRRRRMPFNGEFRCHSGSSYMTISHRAAATIVRFIDERPDVVGVFARSMLSSESFPQTILCNSPGLRICQDDLHYVRMTGAGEAHAGVLRQQDAKLLLASGKPFARKFDDREDPAVLDWLDAQLDRT